MDGGALEQRLRDRGRALGEAGLSLSTLVFDLDETLWDWAAPLGRSLLPVEHCEYVTVRTPLLWLLEGVAERGGGRLVAWTSGYGFRIDQVCAGLPPLAQLFGVGPGDETENLPNVFTRLGFLRALEQRPDLIPNPEGRWLAQKIPGMPTAGGKPLVDAARVLVDDKESNCRRFVDAGDGRSAVWLRGTSRVWKKSVTLYRIPAPPPRRWADGVGDALDAIARGKVGLYPVDPVHSEHPVLPVRVSVSHRRLWRDWLAPARAVERLLAARR